MASVNRPTNVKQKEQDVNQKLQLYGISTAFANGKVPSNEQIDVALNSFLRQSYMTTPSKKLSAEGQALVKDFRDVVEQAKYLLLTKNHGNLIQDFTWQCQNLDGGAASTPNAPVDKNTAKQHGNEALEGIKTLGELIISNGQFRKLLSDATTLIRDIAGDAAQNAASAINPDEKDLEQIDEPAEDNVWHDTPDLSAGNLKKQAKETVQKNSPLSKEDLKEAGRDANQKADPHGSRDPEDTANKAKEHGRDANVDAKGGLKAGMDSLKKKAEANTDDDSKDKAKEVKDKAKDVKNAKKEQAKQYVDKKMPQERREQAIYRLKKMVVEIQGHSDYMSAINTLLDLAEKYTSHASNVASQAAGSVEGAHADSSLQKAEKDLKVLLERFANSTSTDDLFDSLDQIYSDADEDPELKKWFKGMNSYVRRCLKKQGYILEDEATEEWNKLYDQGEYLLRDRYRNHTDRIIDEFKFLGDQFEADPQNKRFGDSVQKLFTDLGNDENGKPTFKPHLVKDLTDVILPAALAAVSYVPIPRIEYSDPMIDAVIENLIIESDNLTPNALEFASDNYWRWGRKNISNRNKNAMMISVSGVQLDLKDVAYYVKKKEGFPSLHDTGVMDIFMGGTGLSFKMKIETADKSDRHNFFKVNSVVVDVKNFDIKLKKSNHKLLFAFAKPIMLKVMRPAIQKVLEKVIKEKFSQLDKYAYEIKKEVDRAQEQVKDDPEQAKNIYSRYASALQKKLTENKKKVEEASADKTTNIATTKHDSIFPKINLPGGISTKATEYKDMAKKGEKWQSPIFGIGSAPATKDIPEPKKISRKSHHVTQGGVRGKQNIGQTSSMTKDNFDSKAASATSNSNTRSHGNTSSQGNSSNGAYATHTYPVDTSKLTSNGPASGYANGSAYGASNGSAGFSNQVDKAFTSEKAGTGLTSDSIHTTLGANNPVLTGQAPGY